MKNAKRILTVMLCLLLLPILSAGSALAGSGNSQIPLVQILNRTSVPYDSHDYWQGDKIIFQLHFPEGAVGPWAAGLVKAGTEISELYDSKGDINEELFLYNAEGSFYLSVDTTNVAPGPYRFVYICPGISYTGVYRPGFAYYDISVKAKETPSSWAADEVAKADYRYLVPQVLSNRYTSPITREHFMHVIDKFVSAKTVGGEGGPVGLVDYASRKNMTLSNNPFEDINKGYHDFVISANKLDIINGKTDTAFDPNGFLTRQEAAAILWRTAKALGLDSSGSASSFADKGSFASWALEGINYVSDKGIMSGVGNNTFDPDGYYTYQQAYITVYRMLIATQGQKPNSGFSPVAGDTKPMGTPFSAADHTLTIISTGPNEEIRGNAKEPKEGHLYYYVTFVESDPEIISYSDLLTIFRQSYLQTADGTRYFAGYEDPWDLYVNRTVGYQIPVGTDISTTVFVANGQARKLK